MDDDLPQPRPLNSIGGGLQHERTALAWERTAVAMMVAGVALARYATGDGHYLLGSAGVLQTAIGGALLMWAGISSDELHSLATDAAASTQVAAARFVGATTVFFTGVGLILVVVVALGD